MQSTLVHEIVNGDNAAMFSVAGNILRIRGLKLKVDGQAIRHIDTQVECSSGVAESFDEVAMAIFGDPYEFDAIKTVASHLSRVVRYRRTGALTALQARACWEVIHGWGIDEFTSVEEFDDRWLSISLAMEDLVDDGMELSDSDLFEVQSFFGEYSVVVHFSDACEAFRAALWEKLLLVLSRKECSTLRH